MLVMNQIVNKEYHVIRNVIWLYSTKRLMGTKVFFQYERRCSSVWCWAFSPHHLALLLPALLRVRMLLSTLSGRTAVSVHACANCRACVPRLPYVRTAVGECGRRGIMRDLLGPHCGANGCSSLDEGDVLMLVGVWKVGFTAVPLNVAMIALLKRC